jgi:hypothetical protein
MVMTRMPNCFDGVVYLRGRECLASECIALPARADRAAPSPIARVESWSRGWFFHGSFMASRVERANRAGIAVVRLRGSTQH